MTLLNPDSEGTSRETFAARGSHLSILLVNVDFPPIGGPGVWRMLSLAKYAALDGHRVRVICGTRSTWHEYSDEKLLAQLPPSVVIERIGAPHNAHIAAWFARHRDAAHWPPLRRLYAALEWRVRAYALDDAWLWGLLAVIRVVWRTLANQPDCIVTSGPPHVSHLSGLVANAISGTPWIVDYRDPWTESLVQMGRGRYQQRIVRMLEAHVLNRASRIVAVSPSWLENLRQKLSKDAQRAKLRLILNGHDLESVRTEVRGAVRDVAGILPGGRLHIHFNGTLQSNNNLINVICQALAALVREKGHQPIVLTFSGLPPAQAKEIADRDLSSYVLDVNYMSQSESIGFAAQADILLILVHPRTALASGVLPAKTYDAMALGKHILCLAPETSDLRTLLADYEAVTFCDPSNPHAIRESLEKLIDTYRTCTKTNAGSPSFGKRPDIGRHSRRERAREFLALVREVI